MGTILSGGRIVTPQETINADIKFENGIIVAIEKNIKAEENDEIIAINGSYVLPGAIDTHTHFDLDTGVMKTADDFKTGTLSCYSRGNYYYS